MSPVSCSEKHGTMPLHILVDVALGIGLAIYVLIRFLNGEPAFVGFFCDDRSLAYPYKDDTISSAILMSAGLIVPLCLVVVTEALKNWPGFSTVLVHILKAFSLFFFGFLVNQIFIDGIKQAVGRPRPNFFDVCRPDFNQINCSRRFITEYTCTNTDVDPKLLREIQLSFPSGHAAFAMFVAVYCVIYLQNRFVCRQSHLLRPIVQTACLIIALLCGISRITDNKHHVTDVVAGIALGCVVAVSTYYGVTHPIMEKVETNKEEKKTPSRQLSQMPILF